MTNTQFIEPFRSQDWVAKQQWQATGQEIQGIQQAGQALGQARQFAMQQQEMQMKAQAFELDRQMNQIKLQEAQSIDIAEMSFHQAKQAGLQTELLEMEIMQRSQRMQHADRSQNMDMMDRWVTEYLGVRGETWDPEKQEITSMTPEMQKRFDARGRYQGRGQQGGATGGQILNSYTDELTAVPPPSAERAQWLRSQIDAMRGTQQGGQGKPVGAAGGEGSPVEFAGLARSSKSYQTSPRIRRIADDDRYSNDFDSWVTSFFRETWPGAQATKKGVTQPEAMDAILSLLNRDSRILGSMLGMLNVHPDIASEIMDNLMSELNAAGVHGQYEASRSSMSGGPR